MVAFVGHGLIAAGDAYPMISEVGLPKRASSANKYQPVYQFPIVAESGARFPPVGPPSSPHPVAEHERAAPASITQSDA
jgi:hypothetical protein